MPVTDEQKWLFLEALAEVPNVSEACRVASCSRTEAYRTRGADPAFAGAWADALGRSVDRLEAAAFKRATEGWIASEALDGEGRVTGRTFKVSDSLVMPLLRAHKPEVYAGPDRLELSGKDGGPIRAEAPLDLSRLSDADLEALAGILERLSGGPNLAPT